MAAAYEYQIIDYKPQKMADIQDKLNALGSQGWRVLEFGSIGSEIRAVFMREVQSPPPKSED